MEVTLEAPVLASWLIHPLKNNIQWRILIFWKWMLHHCDVYLRKLVFSNCNHHSVKPEPTQETLYMSLLSFSLTYFVCDFEDHSMRRDFTSTKVPLSPSILLLNWCVFLLLFPFLFLSCPSLVTSFLVSLSPVTLCLFFFLLSSLFFLSHRSPSGSWSASWSTPGAAPWEEVATTACASSSLPESARRPPGSPVDWSRDTNWRRLLPWWKEKAWPADWWRSVQPALSSSGKTSCFF